MYTKRASLLRVNSVLSLSKVCRSSRGSSESVKCLHNLLRNLSTATERLDLRNSNGYPTENSSDHSYDFEGFNRGGENPGGFQHNPDGQNLNPSGGFKGNPWNDYGREVPGKHMVSVQTPNAVYRNYAGFSGDSFGNENQGNTCRDVGGFEGHNGKNDGNFQWNPSRVYSEGLQGSWKNQNGVHADTSQGFQQNLNGYNHKQSGNYWQNGGVNASYSYSNGFQQQNTGTVRAQNSWNVQNQGWGCYYGGHGQTLQNQGSFRSGVQHQYQGNLNWNVAQNTTQFQQDPNVSNTNFYPHNWQNPSIGQYQTNFDYHNSRSVSQPVEASDGNVAEPNGDVRLEELDEFCKEGKLKEAIEVLRSLTNKGHIVDLLRLLRLAQLCGEAEALQEAKAVHEHISASVSPTDIDSYNKIIEMYSGCGSMSDALNVFNKMPEKNLETWDTMIRGLARNSLGEDAINMFTRFKEEGNKPADQIFKAVFYACATLGDINEGLLHFESMYKDYGISPSMDHYVSIVEMLATPGYLDEAMDFIRKMPMEPNVEVWETLMNLSRIHGNIEVGDRCAELVEQLDSTRLNEQSKVGLIPVKASDLAKEKLKKTSGSQNPLEIRSRVHEYRAGDTSHPENERIYALLRGLKAHMVEMGYIPETRFVLHDVDQESKEEALLAHSERLAFAHGLLTTSARSSIRVIKNLRVCVDCHNALKIISKIVGREFIMRDAKRFHHLKDGVCSCRDYW